jgi:hypothetical protein
MKNILCILALSISASLFSQPLSFSVTNLTGTWTITCATPSIVLQASSNHSAPVQYVWGGPIFPITGMSQVTLTVPGNYTAEAHSSNSLSAYHPFTIHINTVSPVASISPTFQTINCSPSSVTQVTMVATSPTVNVSHRIYSPLGGTTIVNAQVAYYSPMALGTYTHCLENLQNGCMACEMFTVTSNTPLPTFSLVSTPPGFELGCSTKSCIVVNITNAQSSTPGGPVTYTLIPPGSPTTLSSGTLSPNASYTVCTPGTWTAVIKDIAQPCEARVPFTVLSNTLPPGVSITPQTATLNCYNPQVVLTATSNANVNFDWTFTQPPGSQPGSTITANASSAPTATISDRYTVTATNPSNLCRSTASITIYQNRFPPLAAFNGGMIDCRNDTVTLVNTSSTGIPPGSWSSTAAVIPTGWQGPSPLLPATGGSTYAATVAGSYTLEATDLNNGCKSTTVNTVAVDSVYPMGPEPVVVPGPYCFVGDPIVISMPLQGDQTGVIYGWFTPPGGGGSVNSPTYTATVAGIYAASASDTVNGCASVINISVISCLGLEDHLKFRLSVYPNPATDIIYIGANAAMENAFVVLRDLTGRACLSGTISNGSLRIHTETLPRGIYLLEAEGHFLSKPVKVMLE